MHLKRPIVVAHLEIYIFESNTLKPMCGAAHIDNTCAWSRSAELREKKASEEKGTEEVCSELYLKSIFGRAIRTSHDGGIIDENINTIELTVYFCSGRSY